MIKPMHSDVRVFFNQEALHLVLAMPAGENKEAIARPASVLDPCELFIKLGDTTHSYYFLFIIPKQRDSRVLIAAKTLTDMYHFIYKETVIITDPDRERIVNKFDDFITTLENESI